MIKLVQLLKFDLNSESPTVSLEISVSLLPYLGEKTYIIEIPLCLVLSRSLPTPHHTGGGTNIQ